MSHAADPATPIRRNRAFWDADADDYQARHGELLDRRPRAWGTWRVPEDEVGALGDVEGRTVLELGCGGAQWSVALVRDAGARAVGLDQSAGQLRHAQVNAARARVELPLVCGSADAVPLPDRSFDVVFGDHGALSFCDPERSLPEVARLLRPGGRLAFCQATPLIYLTHDWDRDRRTRTLRQSYPELGCIDSGEGTVDWVLPPGEWVRRLRAHGFEVLDLVELLAPIGATTTYREFADHAWASRWPAEQVWVARRRG